MKPYIIESPTSPGEMLAIRHLSIDNISHNMCITCMEIHYVPGDLSGVEDSPLLGVSVWETPLQMYKYRNKMSWVNLKV